MRKPGLTRYDAPRATAGPAEAHTERPLRRLVRDGGGHGHPARNAHLSQVARGRSSMVEPQSSKLATRVRFPSPAPLLHPTARHADPSAAGPSAFLSAFAGVGLRRSYGRRARSLVGPAGLRGHESAVTPTPRRRCPYASVRGRAATGHRRSADSDAGAHRLRRGHGCGQRLARAPAGIRQRAAAGSQLPVCFLLCERPRVWRLQTPRAGAVPAARRRLSGGRRSALPSAASRRPVRHRRASAPSRKRCEPAHALLGVGQAQAEEASAHAPAHGDAVQRRHRPPRPSALPHGAPCWARGGARACAG